MSAAQGASNYEYVSARVRTRRAMLFGAEDYENNVVVDENTRAQRADAADTARIEDAAATASLGESGKATADTAEHLQPDDAGELYGTKDMKKAIEEGKAYTPPDSPVQEGVRGDEQH